jgi:hypothetical protein
VEFIMRSSFTLSLFIIYWQVRFCSTLEIYVSATWIFFMFLFVRRTLCVLLSGLVLYNPAF